MCLFKRLREVSWVTSRPRSLPTCRKRHNAASEVFEKLPLAVAGDQSDACATARRPAPHMVRIVQSPPLSSRGNAHCQNLEPWPEGSSTYTRGLYTNMILV